MPVMNKIVRVAVLVFCCAILAPVAQAQPPQPQDEFVPVGNSRQQFAAYIKAELVKWADVVKRSGARIE